MRRVTIAVIGNGKTTRANVEALITDMVEAMDSVALASVYKDKPSDGQVWSQQLAESKNIPWVAYDSNDYKTLLKEHKDSEIKFFMLWSDEDPDCQLAASVAQENNILAYDLTDGLMKIALNSAPIAEPVVADIPEVETQVSDEPITPPVSEPSRVRRISLEDLEATIEEALAADEEAEDEEYEEESAEVIDDLGDLLKALIEEMATIFANKVAEELVDKFKGLQ